MTAASVTALSLAAMALLLTVLSVNVSRLRLRYRVSWGDGGHRDLLAAMRAHGNTLEQTTVYGLLALAFASLPGARTDVQAVLATTFVAARVAHALGVFARRLALRQAAHGVTVLVHLGQVVALLLTLGPTPWPLR